MYACVCTCKERPQQLQITFDYRTTAGATCSQSTGVQVRPHSCTTEGQRGGKQQQGEPAEAQRFAAGARGRGFAGEPEEYTIGSL